MMLSVPFSLEQPVSFHIAGVAVSISSPVIAVLFYPTLLSPLLVVPVIGILFKLMALPLSFTETSAFFFIAISLVLYSAVGKKKPAAVWIGTSDLLSHGPSLREKTMTLCQSIPAGEE
jgi:hypothetical protein